MEELQSTEILDREILEDARKKAQRILKTAEDTINAQNAEWEKKTAKNIETLETQYNELKNIEEKRVMARLPIDKLRAKIDKIETLLQQAVETWYKSLSRKQILELMGKAVDSMKKVDSEQWRVTEVCGLEREEIEAILSSIPYSALVTGNYPLSTANYPSITLETDNVRITSSIERMAERLLLDKRAELIELLEFTEEV
ncbi:MAG: ATPase [Treponema sp.]|nr:ATPase [Treponema sp.]